MHAPVHASVYVHTTWQAAYNDSFKLQLINDHYASLPGDAWAMTPDVDELYHYPCTSLPRLVSRGADLFCGIMEDMQATRGARTPDEQKKRA